MLEQKDLDVLREMLRTELSAHIQKTENLLLDEIGRTQTYLEKQICDIKKNIETLEQYYRITKPENDNTTILLKSIEDMQKQLTEIEKKIA
ncbi:hypothetical protein H8S37_10705 [Mediterraneibacter sp. NSJ-55]|uniref:Uncharacterized protein n=1 Tax=Mediterraneibacter hominis TaxID=2763054 RepID=A0A923RQD7_9FIRM|nr:hypothetical protein [Mediterraneibacter hominis]MBC5689386.1 hypothetical protein [Mediterraneibacter hominis]